MAIYKKIKNQDCSKYYFCGINFYTKKIMRDNKQASSLRSFALNSNELNIAIKLKGGLGDQLIGINYVYCLMQKIAPAKNIAFYIFCRDYIHELLKDDELFKNKLFKEQSLDDSNKKFDLFIRLDRFPVILHKNDKKIARFSKFLPGYLSNIEKFFKEYNRFLKHNTAFDGFGNILSIIQGKKRFQQCDIDNMLDIQKFSYPLNANSKDSLSKFDLSDTNYITLHYGVDINHTAQSIKLWPFEYYEALIEKIKQFDKKITIVQLGVNSQRCPAMKGADINLVGKTAIKEVKNILKHSLLHIDCEGGFVHLRRALNGGKSIVLFGPTSPDFYGYCENANISSKVCPHWCEHTRDKWDTFCPKTNSAPPLCLQSITPDTVMKEFKKIFKGFKNVA
jgi:hypothetical protein